MVYSICIQRSAAICILAITPYHAFSAKNFFVSEQLLLFFIFYLIFLIALKNISICQDVMDYPIKIVFLLFLVIFDTV